MPGEKIQRNSNEMERKYTRKIGQVVTDLHASCNKVVVKPISECTCSHCLFPVVVTSLEQVVIALLQG